MRSIQSVEYYETMKKEGRSINSTLWTDLENMMVSERCQTYKTL